MCARRPPRGRVTSFGGANNPLFTAWRLAFALLLSGCPQLLDDDFETPAGEPLGLDASSSAAGAGGDSSESMDGGSTSSLGGAGGSPGDAGSAGASAAVTCTDGVQEPTEQGIDCGGECPACPCSFGPFSTPELLGLDIAGDEHGPSLSLDGLTLYFSAQGQSSEDIFVATRADKESAFTAAVPLATVNSPASDGSPSLTADGTALLLFSDRSGGPGNRDLWRAAFDELSGAFEAPSLVPGVNSPDLDLSPELSPGGLSLFFVSSRPGGSGQSDIWAAKRSDPMASFAAPVSRGDLNSAGRDEGLSLSRDGLSILFASNREDASNLDLWTASRSDVSAAFGAATRLEELNSSADDLDPELSPDGRQVIFVSARGSGNRRLWHATRQCE